MDEESIEENGWCALEEQIERKLAEFPYDEHEQFQYAEAMRLAHALATKRGILIDAQTLLEEMAVLSLQLADGFDAESAAFAKGMAGLGDVVSRIKNRIDEQ